MRTDRKETERKHKVEKLEERRKRLFATHKKGREEKLL